MRSILLILKEQSHIDCDTAKFPAISQPFVLKGNLSPPEKKGQNQGMVAAGLRP
jgi:hypothetical protein